MDNVLKKAQPSTRLGRLFSNKDLLHLFFPLVIEQILVISVGMADSMMVASLGEAAVSGVSLIDHIGVLLNLVFVALATGGSVIIGQYMGRGDLDKAREGGRQLIWLTGIVSLVLMVAFYASKSFIFAKLFGSSSPDVIENATEYMMVLGTTIPFMALFQGGSAVFRTAGNTKLPMLTVVLMNILNIIGNGLSVFVLGWGVTGVALSTLNSRIVSVIIILYCGRKYKFRLQIPPPFKSQIKS
jgi:Na+-driven multidrug efflux pump